MSCTHVERTREIKIDLKMIMDLTVRTIRPRYDRGINRGTVKHGRRIMRSILQAPAEPVQLLQQTYDSSVSAVTLYQTIPVENDYYSLWVVQFCESDTFSLPRLFLPLLSRGRARNFRLTTYLILLYRVTCRRGILSTKKILPNILRKIDHAPFRLSGQ